METMQALRIELIGDVASFRYPHFMWGVQPTFEMPPPATIYGHICSAVGEWIAPEGLRFAYHFTHEGRFYDLEHIHAGWDEKPAMVKQLRKQGYSDISTYGESTVTPFQRELLFRPRLTLYLDRLDLEPAFRSPRYTVVFGRSQDLCFYPPNAVQVVTLEQRDTAYYEHTILPLIMGTATQRGIAITMPRYVDYEMHRQPTFAQYVMLNETVQSEAMQIIGAREPIWCDPTTPLQKGNRRAVVWHRFVGE